MSASIRALPVGDAAKAADLLLREPPKELLMFMVYEDRAHVYYTELSGLTQIVGMLERLKFSLQYEQENAS